MKVPATHRSTREANRRGSVLILSAILLTVMLGAAGYAIDAGNLSAYRHRMQSAADAGAIAGAYEVKRASSISINDLQTFVYHETAANGFTNGVDGVTVTVNHGPASGAFAGDAKYVEVIISRAVPTYLMGLFGRPAVTVSTRGVAGQNSGSVGCIYAMGTGQNAFQTASTAEVHVPNCDIYVNSSNSKAMFTGDATVEAHAINVVGGLGGSPDKTEWIIDGESGWPTTGATPVASPYNLTAPPAGACTSFSIPSSSAIPVTLNPGTYCQDIVISNAVVNFNPGLYVLKDATLKISGNSTVVRGTGVTFFSVGTVLHTLIIDSGTDVKLSAPTSGDWATILFASLLTGVSVGNRLESDNMALNGVIYFPNMHLEFKGNSAADYTILVVDNVKFNGNSSLNSNFVGLPGGSGSGSVSKAE